MSDIFESTYGVSDPNGDPDADGFTNIQECLLGGNPLAKDTPGQITLSLYHYDTSDNGIIDLPQIECSTIPGKRYRIEYRGAADSTWRAFYWAGVEAEFTASANSERTVDPYPLESRYARFYRIVGLEPLDLDGDGLDSWEETVLGTDPSMADTDGDGNSDAAEYLAGTAATQYFNANSYTITKILGDHQAGGNGAFLPLPLTVSVARNGVPAVNAVVHWSVTRGASKISASPEGTQGTSLINATDSTGRAKVCLKFSNAVSGATWISATISGPSGFKLCHFVIYPGYALGLNLPLPLPVHSRLQFDQGLQVDSSGKVSAWNDLSGSGHNARGMTPASAYPLPRFVVSSGRDAALFDGNAILELDRGGLVNTFTTMLVAKATASRDLQTMGTTFSHWFDGQTNQRYALAYSLYAGNPSLWPWPVTPTANSWPNTSQIGIVGMGLSVGINGFGAYDLRENYTPCIANVTRTRTSPTLLSAVYNNKAGTFSELGVWKASSMASLASEVRAPSYIGAVLTPSTNSNQLRYGFQGEIYDVLVFGRNLTTAEQTQAEDYLAARHNLPADRDYDGLPDWWERMFFGTLSNYGPSDFDGDGRNNSQEYAAGTNPTSTDSDSDGISDAQELATGRNPGEPDSNVDGYFDGSSNTGPGGLLDADHDGRPDGWIWLPWLDSDGDGLPNSWESAWGLNSNSDLGEDGALGDPDGDGLVNVQEVFYGTNPLDADTDEDGLPDAWEVLYGLNPISTVGRDGGSGDPDGDGLANTQEYSWRTNPLVGDTDLDGMPDGLEAAMPGGEPNNFNAFPGIFASSGTGGNTSPNSSGGPNAGSGGGNPEKPKTVDLKFSIKDDTKEGREYWELILYQVDKNGMESVLKSVKVDRAGGSKEETITVPYGQALRVRLQWQQTKRTPISGSTVPTSPFNNDYTAAVSILNKPNDVELVIQDPGWVPGRTSTAPPTLFGTHTNVESKHMDHPPNVSGIPDPLVANIAIAYLRTETKNPSYAAVRASMTMGRAGPAMLKKNKERNNIGINEEVKIVLEPQSAWGKVFGLNGSEVLWTSEYGELTEGGYAFSKKYIGSNALTETKTPAITALISGTTLKTTFNLKIPSGISVDPFGDADFGVLKKPNGIGIGKHLKILIQPDNVTFGAIGFMEEDAPFTSADWFDAALVPNSHHPAPPIYFHGNGDDEGWIPDTIQFALQISDWTIVEPGTATADYRIGYFFRPLVDGEQPNWFGKFIHTMKILNNEGKADVDKQAAP